MIIVKIKSSSKFTDILPVILDDAMLRKDNHIVLLCDKGGLDTLRVVLNGHKKVGRVLAGAEIIYCIKDMRIQLEEIEYEI